MKISARFVTSLFAILTSSSVFAQESWRVLDPENTLIIESSKGRLILEMRPDMAPKSVERVKLLAREKTYDGLQFHRVIAGFVAQTGNPNNRDGGGTSHPNLAPEMMFKQKLNSGEIVVSNGSISATGFLGGVPFQATPITDVIKNTKGSLRAWGAHCPGVAGMGRNEARDSANSELYFMLDSARRLDRDYTVFGRIVVGMDILKNINLGEPPTNPDIMKTVRVLADISAAERPKVSVMTGTALSAEIDKVRQQKGADFSVCDVVISAKVE
ncbi:MAG: peptidylprolyl isomerase [Pseudomonadota bacterium]